LFENKTSVYGKITLKRKKEYMEVRGDDIMKKLGNSPKEW
jgi:hypothetical protein